MLPQKAMGIWEHGAGVAMTHQWELSELGGEISELWVREPGNGQSLQGAIHGGSETKGASEEL